MGIQALAPEPGTSKTAPGNKVYPYLLRKLDINRPNQFGLKQYLDFFHRITRCDPLLRECGEPNSQC
jgi:hypothetical protein